MKDRNIILCGFMGSGKTLIGKKLAKKLDREFCDMDRYIENAQGKKVSEIFAQSGEQAFRKIENETVKQISKKKNMIIACGGGTILSEENVKEFNKSGGLIIFLDVPLAALQERLKRDKRRPLLQVPNRREVIEDLHKKRMPRYKKAADVTINAGAPANVVVNRIIKLMD